MSTSHIIFEDSRTHKQYDAYWSSVPQEGQTIDFEGGPYEVTKVRWKTHTISEASDRRPARLGDPKVHITIAPL